jgi:E3 ubiquitin-protein ligase UBR7
MGTTPCSLRKVSLQPLNMKNHYNHNFEGRFCDCDQVYDVDAEEGTMFQCLVCEDWFHEKCIGEGRVPDQDDFDGFVCKNCVGKNEWLGRYVAKKDIFMSTLDIYPEVKVDIESSVPAPSETQNTSTTAPTSSVPDNAINGVKRSLSTEPESKEQPPKRVKVEEVLEESSEQCHWASLPPSPSMSFAMFLKENFRDHLCRCITCEIARLRTLPMISHEEETYEPEEDNSDTGI